MGPWYTLVPFARFKKHQDFAPYNWDAFEKEAAHSARVERPLGLVGMVMDPKRKPKGRPPYTWRLPNLETHDPVGFWGVPPGRRTTGDHCWKLRAMIQGGVSEGFMLVDRSCVFHIRYILSSFMAIQGQQQDTLWNEETQVTPDMKQGAGPIPP